MSWDESAGELIEEEEEPTNEKDEPNLDEYEITPEMEAEYDLPEIPSLDEIRERHNLYIIEALRV